MSLFSHIALACNVHGALIGQFRSDPIRCILRACTTCHIPSIILLQRAQQPPPQLQG